MAGQACKCASPAKRHGFRALMVAGRTTCYCACLPALVIPKRGLANALQLGVSQLFSATDVFLKSLTLKGFKSFADTTVMELEPGVTVVVGPNGSGKSNVVDAIAWVLGAQAP